MAHAHTDTADCTSPRRIYSSVLLLLAIASLLVACGGATSSDVTTPAAGAASPPTAPGGGGGGGGGGGAPGTGDTTAPTTPVSLTISVTVPARASLSWQPSSDAVGVTAYSVERCQGAGCSAFAVVGAPTGTSFNDAGLVGATSYSYRVRAGDAAGNQSAYSNIASATTLAADTSPPTAPTGLTATTDGPFRTQLSWVASTDNIAVTGYSVERCLGVGCSAFAAVGSPTGTTFTDTGLAAATVYNYRVRATDASQNLGAFSNVASVTTAIAPTPPLATLPAWVSALAIGAWHEIPNSSISSVEPTPVPPGNGPDSKVGAWTSFVVDTRTSKIYSVANGGHNDYAGNEVDVLDIERDQPVWSQVKAPSPSNQLTDCQSYYSDGTPSSRHSYYGVTFNEINDRIMLFGGAEWCSSGAFHSGISSYNIGSNTYSPSNTHGALPGGFDGVAAFSVDPTTGNVYGIRGFNFGRWTRASGANGTFTVLNPTSGSPPPGDDAMSAMDTTRGRILFLGGNDPNHAYYTISSNSFTDVSPGGPNASVLPGGGRGMLYIAAIDRFLVRLSGLGGAVYQIDPVTFAVTPFTTTGGGAIPATQNGPYNKFLYVPRLGGVAYVPTYNGNTWFLRVHP